MKGSNTDRWEKIAEFLQSSLVRKIITIYIIVVVVFFLYVFYSEKQDTLLNNLDKTISQKEQLHLKKILDSVTFLNLEKTIKQFEKYNYAKKDSIRYSKDILFLKLRIDTLQKQVVNNNEMTLSLRQSINPIKPDEILTIARLKDEIVSIKQNQQSFEKRMDDKIQNLSQLVISKVDNSDKASNLIILILAPIVLNFLYTIWKDYKDDKKDRRKKS